MRAWIVALLLLSLPLAGCLSEPAPAPEAPGEDGSEGPPEWSFTDLQGTTHDQTTTQGTPSVLFFMATWCSSCRAMTDDLRQVHQEHNASGVQVLSLSWDQSETEEDLAGWKADYEQPWPHGIDPGSNTARALGVTSQSSVVVLDQDGHIAKRWGYGQADASSIDQVLEDLQA